MRTGKVHSKAASSRRTPKSLCDVTLGAALCVGTGNLRGQFRLGLDRRIVTFEAVDVISVLVVHLQLLPVFRNDGQLLAVIPGLQVTRPASLYRRGGRILQNIRG